MSKYTPLWEHIKSLDKDSLCLTFSEIENIAGLPIDHSFLTYKKELNEYGHRVVKVSMKKQTVLFEKIK